MLSVLHVLTSLNLGGAEKFTLELAKYQREHDLDAQVLNLGHATDFLTTIAQDTGIPVTTVESTRGRLSRLSQIKHQIASFDVIHIHSPRALRFIAPVLLILSSAKIVYTRHGLDPLDSFTWRTLHKLINSRIDYITFVTQAGYDVFYQNHNWDRGKMCVIENGVSIPQERICNMEPPIRFGSVGRMIGLKGQVYLLNAIGHLLDTDAAFGDCLQLHFFGSGPLETLLKQQAMKLTGTEIQFHGEEHDTEKIYSTFDVLVVASESEGLSMVIIEAMARGIPVIATAVGGNTTLVKDKTNGIIIPYGDSPALAEAMKEVLVNPELIAIYGKESRDFVAEDFSIGKTFSNYLSCYQ